MTTPSRREKIEAMLAEDPRDIFLRYSLALELEKEGAHEDSLRYLGALMEESPPYVPAFFMAGQQLVRQNRVDEARTILRSGIEAARAQNETHTAGEMCEFLVGLGTLGEAAS